MRLAERGDGDGLTIGDFMGDSFTGTWDVVFATQVLEHIIRPLSFVDKIAASLTPGGIIHLDVPSQFTLAGFPSRLLRGIGSRFGAIEWPHHAIAYNVKALARIFNQSVQVSVSRLPPMTRYGARRSLHVMPRGPNTAHHGSYTEVLHRESLLVAYGRSGQKERDRSKLTHGEETAK